MKSNIKNNLMNRYGILMVLLALAFYVVSSCNDNYPMDEDGLLITDRSECYVSSFQLLGTDFISVTVGTPDVDTTKCTIEALVRYGTDLKNLYPQFALVTDAKLEPKITGLTDFTSLSKQWTVISGNRQVRKTYTVTLTLQTP